MTTETLDKLYLEWSQFTTAKTWRDLIYETALSEISQAQKDFDDPVDHANFCIERAKLALSDGARAAAIRSAP